MKQNMGTIDRVFRLIVAIILATLLFTGQVTDIAAVILGIIAAVFLLTSIIGFCPAYLPLGLSTRKGGQK